MEVIGLNNYAPPLYSALIRVLFLWAISACSAVRISPQRAQRNKRDWDTDKRGFIGLKNPKNQSV